VTGVKPQVATSGRDITLLQRKTAPVGSSLGRTTGWTHRLTLQRRGVQMLGGVEYDRIDDQGLHLRVEGEPRVLAVDTVIVCAGQEPARGLYDELIGRGINPQLIGGAFEASELDAKRAIKQATELAVAV
jgi:2,4-dienoyl-CoA reductase (NADPH2)